jgi:hypothetical protein
MPDDPETPEVAGVVLLSAEDGLADTIRPRLEAAGADLSRVVALTAIRNSGGEETFPTIAAIEQLEIAIRRVDARLVIVDPLMAYLSPEVNAYRDQHVRKELAPLAALAQRSGVAIVLVRHLRKGSRSDGALYAGGGSIGIAGAARSVLLVGRDPEVEERRVLARAKGNLSKTPPSLAFRLAEAPNGVATVKWEPSPVEITADRLLAASAVGEEEKSARDEARDWLVYFLADGPHPAQEVFREGQKAGHAVITIRRAATALGVRKAKAAFQGGWSWSLPEFEDDHGPSKALSFRSGASSAPGDHLRGPEPRIVGDPKAQDCGYHVGPLVDPCVRCSRTYLEHGLTSGGCLHIADEH